MQKKTFYLQALKFKNKPALTDLQGNIYVVTEKAFATRLAYAAKNETMVKVVIGDDGNSYTVAKSATIKDCIKSAKDYL